MRPLFTVDGTVLRVATGRRAGFTIAVPGQRPQVVVCSKRDADALTPGSAVSITATLEFDTETGQYLRARTVTPIRLAA